MDANAVTDLARRLDNALGADVVISDRQRFAGYETDWTRRYHGRASLVLLPRSTEEVSTAVRLCQEAGAAVVPQGGNTGLVGGGVPRRGEVVLSLSRMRSIDPVDIAAGQVTADAGVTLAALQRHARGSGLDVGIDFAARESASIGGIAATNSGGLRVLRNGTARNHIVGVEAVLANGHIVSRLTGLAKDNVGYDLRSMLIGSEGTLAIFTRIRVRLVPILPRRAVAILGLNSVADAVAVLAGVRARLPNLESAEIVFDDGVELVCSHKGLARPLPSRFPVYLLIECADHDDPSDDLLDCIADQCEIGDAAVAMDATDRARLWEYRESHTEVISAAGVPIKLDVAIPLRRVAEFEARLRKLRITSFPDVRVILFGHLAEGNFHINLVGTTGAPHDDVVAEILQLVSHCEGSIGAEHGIGQAKRSWIHLSRSPEEIEAMVQIKRALDSKGILNPGVIFDQWRLADSA